MDGFTLINEQNFDHEVLQSSLPVLLEFGGEWCKPCKSLEPLLLKLEGEWGGRIRLAKLDVDECPDITMQHQVMSLPTMILFVHGEQREVMVGLQSADKIRAMVESYL